MANTRSSQYGGRASSQTNSAANAGARWGIASTPAAHVSDTAATWISVPAKWLSTRVARDPAAAPVAIAGVSMPPTAPARRNSAVRRGFNSKMTAAAPSIKSLLRLTVRMLLPLPGSSGHQIEQTPVISPAAAIVGIRIHDRNCTFGRARAMTRSNARPTATASGAMANAKNTNRYDNRAVGHVSACSRWVTGEATATARLDVIKAAPTARGCHVPSRILAANNAPPSGTL